MSFRKILLALVVAGADFSFAEVMERVRQVVRTVEPHDSVDRAIADGEAQGFVKVLTVPGRDRILGEHAGGLIAEYVLAMKQGIGLNKILGTIHIYPTLAEANKYAASVWKKTHAREKLLAWVERFHDWRRGGGA